MERLTDEERDELLTRVENTAFHLELKDDYRVVGEDEHFRKWLNREHDDLEWFQPWLTRMRTVTQAGKIIRRVRVVTEPITDYIRWEYEFSPLNIDAGEDIHWLPRRMAQGIEFSDNDFWLLDDQTVVFNHFHDDGRSAGAEVVTTPETVQHCRQAWEQVWGLSIPHSEYEPA